MLRESLVDCVTEVRVGCHVRVFFFNSKRKKKKTSLLGAFRDSAPIAIVSVRYSMRDVRAIRARLSPPTFPE